MRIDAAETKSERLLSLDVFRGITIAGMVLVNNQGDWGQVYPMLEHAPWNGFTPTDAVFPFFLFIVGLTTTLSLTKRKERGDSSGKLLLQIFRRSVLLILLGMIKDNYPFFDFPALQVTGVLQRIGFVYFCSGVIFLVTSPRLQVGFCFLFLLLYWALMSLVPVPGIGAPNLDQTTNLGAYIDRLLLGGHLSVKTKVWDAAGLFSSIPAISSALFGVLTGHLLRSRNDPHVKIIRMFVWGNIAIILGLIWDLWFPINKNLWTSSYVVYSTGLALNFFAICYWLVDINKITWWTKPFVVYGMNALFVYFISGIFGRTIKNLIFVTNAEGVRLNLKDYAFQSYIRPWFDSPYNASVAWAILMVLFWLGILWILYRRRIFVRV
jgi:predicted acyltransferase